MALWKAACSAEVTGRGLPCGHFLPEEQPEATAAELHRFLAA
jgi:haloacetate dehalogenase